jgi:hypothetical protein
MHFDFYFKRTLFRTMTLFYKQAFRGYFEMFRTQKETNFPIEKYLAEWVQETQPGLLESMRSNAEIIEYIQLLKLVVFAHRYNKDDEFMANPIINFDVIRDPMYRFSRSAEKKFLSVPVLSYLLAWFAKSPAGQNFVALKCTENADSAFEPGLTSEVREMGTKAKETLDKNCSLFMYIS